LSRNTTAKEIAEATAWTSEKENQLNVVVARIAQSQTKETLKKAQRLQTASNRSKELSDAITKSVSALSKGAVSALNERLDAVAAAEKAAEIAAHASLQDEPLPAGTSNEWRLLYEAAREYSTAVAYPGRVFLASDVDVLCVLRGGPAFLDSFRGRDKWSPAV
jgi:hypothetical protein